jgi:hypothetical protein
MKRTDKEGKQMLLTMKSLYDDNPAFATLRPAYVPVMAAVTIVLGKIIDAQTAQSIVITGDATNKENKFNDLAKALFKIASAASAYASKPSVNDPILKAKVNFTIVEILDVNYNSTQAFANNIINAVSPTAVLSNLSDYGVTALQLTAATDALAAFLLIQNTPQADIATRKTDTADIHPLVKQGKALLLDEGDPIANTTMDDNHTLYSLWYSGRNIVHFPHGTTVAEGFVFGPDGVTGIYNAEVKFGTVILKTFIDGSYRYPHYPHGVATPTATATGMNPNTAAPYEIKQGKTVKHNFTMTAI